LKRVLREAPPECGQGESISDIKSSGQAELLMPAVGAGVSKVTEKDEQKQGADWDFPTPNSVVPKSLKISTLCHTL
jgi:hypothetical protein